MTFDESKDRCINIIILLLVSVAIVLLGYPYLLSQANSWLTLTIIEYNRICISVTVIAIIFYLLSWRWLVKELRKYNNTKKLKSEPLTWIDALLILALSIIFQLLIIISKNGYVFEKNNEMLFLLSNSVFAISWLSTAYISSLKKLEKIVSMNKKRSSNSDQPIELVEHDLLGREVFVEQFKNEILGLEIMESFVFGLHGEWGEGKTSVIKMLISKLELDETILIVDYDPWAYKDEKAMIQGFYSEVQGVIQSKFILSGIGSTISRYHRFISAGTSAFFGFSLDWFPSESYENMRKRLEKYLILTQRKLVIFIDEIDRLRRDEIHQVFKLVRANARFNNTIFILAFDKGAVAKTLGKDIDSEFLNKMVDKPMLLPLPVLSRIDGFLAAEISDLLGKLDLSKLQLDEATKSFFEFYTYNLIGLFSNLREIKRYLNSLRTSLPVIAKEVSIYDFMLLEILKVTHDFDHIYKDIRKHPWVFQELKWSGLSSYHLQPPAFRRGEAEVRNDLASTKIIKIVDEVQDEHKKEIAKSILSTLFPSAERAFKGGLGGSNQQSYRNQKRIAHPDCFQKYFTSQVPENEISDEEIEIVINQWQESSTNNKLLQSSILEVFSNMRNRGMLKDFLEILVHWRGISLVVAETLIRVIYTNVSFFSKEGTEDFWNSEYDKANRLLLFLINGKISKEKIQEMLHEVVLQCSDIYFAVATVLHCKKERGGSLYNIYSIDVLALQKALSKRLKKYYVDERRDIYEEIENEKWSLILYQWISNWQTDKSNEIVVHDYLLSLYKKKPEAYIKLLKTSRGRSIVMSDDDDEPKAVSVPKGFDFSGIIQYFTHEELLELARNAQKSKDLRIEDANLLDDLLKYIENVRKNNQRILDESSSL